MKTPNLHDEYFGDEDNRTHLQDHTNIVEVLQLILKEMEELKQFLIEEFLE